MGNFGYFVRLSLNANRQLTILSKNDNGNIKMLTRSHAQSQMNIHELVLFLTDFLHPYVFLSTVYFSGLKVYMFASHVRKFALKFALVPCLTSFC